MIDFARRKYGVFIDEQYRRPSGFIGQFIGARMARQHQPENKWSVSLLDLQPSDHVLEIGFGPGIAIELLASLTPDGHVAGIDYSRKMVSLASRRNREAIQSGRVALCYGEATVLPFASESFDKVLSIHTLYFWHDPVEALREGLRVLKPGGTFSLTFLPKERWPGGDLAATINGVYSGEEVVCLMKDAGFVQARVERGPEQKPFRELSVVGVKYYER